MSALPKAVRVLVGIVGMALFIGIVAVLLLRHAGVWGVPYFPFTSDRGSQCRNTLTGYVCSPLNLADVEYWAEIDLPDSTVVKEGTYTATHDYQLTASLIVPAAAAWDGQRRGGGRVRARRQPPVGRRHREDGRRQPGRRDLDQVALRATTCHSVSRRRPPLRKVVTYDTFCRRVAAVRDHFR